MAAVRGLLFLLLFAIGVTKFQIGISRHRPIGLLLVLLLATAVVGLVMMAKVPRTTLRGARLVKEQRAVNSPLKYAATRNDKDATWRDDAMAVALFGMGGLATGSDLATALRVPQSGGGDGGSGGSSCGGGGCGGGGCGGCGG
jgi:uncharacterized protein (TIGR04222 family)